MAEKIYDAYHQEIELTDEQQACLKYSGDRTLMVKGYAGAGKSVVLMQAARKLLGKYGPDAKNKVAIFTFQNTLVSTTREFLQVNGTAEDGVVVNTINSFISDLYELLIVCGAAPKRKYPWGKNSDKIRIDNVKKALRAHQTKYGKHRFHSIDPEFWLEEFDWMKDMNIWKDDMDLYLSTPRKGRGGKVRMSANDRVTAYQLYTCYCDYLEKTKQADWADQTLFIIRHPELIPDKMKFDYILIDEAQDLSLAQMMVLLQLYKKNMIVAMDANQRIFKKQWTAKQLGIEATTKKLTKSMRTTKQIDALAESIRSKNDDFLSDDDRSLRAIPEREGNIPELVHLDDAAAERKYVVSLVKKYQESNDKITIGIIAAKNKQIPIYAEWFASENILHEHVKKDSTFSMAKPGVKIASAYGAKGLEFDVVIIPMFVEGNFPYGYQPEDEESYEQYMIQMRNLVYVSMTRAKFHLVLTFWGKGSRFIADMSPDLYKMVGTRPNIEVPVFTQPMEEKKEKPVAVVNEKEPNPRLLQTNYSSNAVSNQKISGLQGAKKTPDDLVSYLTRNGLEVLDKRPKNGALWVVGDKSIDPILQETKKMFGTRWTYKAEGGLATKHRPSWYTKSEK